MRIADPAGKASAFTKNRVPAAHPYASVWTYARSEPATADR
jgi:hypothetical protein